MLLSERHARIRAHEDKETVDKAHAFVLDSFGGDFERAVAFLSEVSTLNSIAPDRTKFYSVRQGHIKWHTLRRR